MKLIDVLNPAAIIDSMTATNKTDALVELTDAILRAGNGLDRDAVIKAVQEREQLGSTGIGHGIAIPHGKLKGLERILVAFGRSRNGIDFQAMDDMPVHLFFLLLAPQESNGEHLKVLACISKLMKNPEVRQRLMDAVGVEALLRIISEEEDKLF